MGVTGGRETILPVLVVGLVILTPMSSISGTALSETTGGASAVTPNVQNKSEYVDLDAADLPGSGTEDDPYQISNVSELQAMEDDLDAHYVLVSDINASTTATANNGRGFDPIGNRSSPFSGSLDGNGHTINSLTINRPTTDYVGLFGAVNGYQSPRDDTVTIKNIRIKDVDISGGNDTGALIGFEQGVTNLTVQNIVVTGNVTGLEETGGLIGIAQSATIRDVRAQVNVSGEQEVGGLVGLASGGSKINNSTVTGSVTGGDTVGGAVGYLTSEVTRVFTDVSVSGRGAVGGLVGTNYGMIQDTIAVGNVSFRIYGGGLVGSNPSGTIEDSYWDVNATGQSTSAGNATGLTTAEMTGANATANMPGLTYETVWTPLPDDYPALTDRDVLVRFTSKGRAYQRGFLTNVTGNVSANSTVQITIRIEAIKPEAEGNIVYGAIGNGDGTVYALSEPSSGTTNITLTATIPANATGDIYWTWVPAISEASARDKAALSFSAKVGAEVPDDAGPNFGVDGILAFKLGSAGNPGPSTNPVTGETPTDPNGDGLYEDVNGNGQRDIGDVQALFALLTRDDSSNYLEENTEFFDFNGNGRIDIGDVQALFTQIAG